MLALLLHMAMSVEEQQQQEDQVMAKNFEVLPSNLAAILLK